MILSPGPTLRIDVSTLPISLARRDSSPTSDPSLHLEEVERAHILRVLREVGWRIKGADSASVRLGMKPSTLYGRIKRLGIVKER
jgi:formate hydrogenlyase transcriptional activator